MKLHSHINQYFAVCQLLFQDPQVNVRSQFYCSGYYFFVNDYIFLNFVRICITIVLCIRNISDRDAGLSGTEISSSVEWLIVVQWNNLTVSLFFIYSITYDSVRK